MIRYAQMTAHVVTRPYRAPEAILCAGNYSQVLFDPSFIFAESHFIHASRTCTRQAIDVWSVGCIFAELLELLNQNPLERTRRPMPIFHGTMPKGGGGECMPQPVLSALQCVTLGCSVGEARGRGAAVQNIFHNW